MNPRCLTVDASHIPRFNEQVLSLPDSLPLCRAPSALPRRHGCKGPSTDFGGDYGGFIVILNRFYHDLSWFFMDITWYHRISHDITWYHYLILGKSLVRFREFIIIYYNLSYFMSMNIHEHSLSSLANQYHNPWRHGAMWQATRVCQTRDDQRGGLEAQLHRVISVISWWGS